MSPAEGVDPITAKELESLMKEFPEWKKTFPDIYDRLIGGRRNRLQQKKKNRREEDFVDSLQATDGHSKERGKRKEGIRKEGEQGPKASLVTGRDERHRRRAMAVHDYESKCISYINDWDDEPQTRGNWHGVDTMRQRQPRPRQPRVAKTNDQLIKELVQTSRLIVKPNDPAALRLDLNSSSPDKHDNESSWIRLHGHATTMDHFRLPQTDQTIPDGPLPERAQVLLYPDRGQNCYESTTQATYRGLQAKRPDLTKPFDGSLKPEGDMEMDTTTRAAYKSYNLLEVTTQPHSKGGTRIKIGSTTLPVIPHQGKFYGETQTMRDFPGFGDGQPSPPEPIPPAPNNLGVPYHVRRSFETEQRRQFAGIDPVQHPPSKRINKLRDSIQLSEEPFETMTNHKLDYLPIKHHPPVRRSLPPLHHSVTAHNKSRAFDGQTTNQLFFKEWPLSPRQRHGDFHDDYSSNVPTINRVSMNRLGVQSEPQRNNLGEFDTTFAKPSPLQGLTKVQVTMLLKELRRRKMDKEESIKENGSRNH